MEVKLKLYSTWFTKVVIGAFICSTVSTRAVEGVTNNQVNTRPNDQWHKPLDYLDSITSLFQTRLRQHGSEKLPVMDKQYTVNVTRYNTPLLGEVRFSNGRVEAILNISRYYRQYIWFTKKEEAVVRYKILMGDVVVIYDLDANLEVETLAGRAELTFPENLLEVVISCNLTTMAVGVTSMTTNAVAGPKSNFTPDSAVMRAVAYNARLTMASSLFADLTPWIDGTLKELLQAVVQEVAFPLQLRE